MKSSWKLRLPHGRWLLMGLILGLTLYASVSFFRIVTNSLDSSGGTDFYTYWHVNHFLRQGDDPYQAYIEGARVQLPVRYLDGHVAASYPLVQANLGAMPGNSPPMLFMLLPFSYLSWTTAKVIWMVLNIGVVLAIPWLVFRLFPVKLDLFLCVIAALVFYGMPGTRAVVVTGQTGILVFFLVLLTLALVRKKRRLLAGLAVGLALSKFSIAIPLFLFLLYKRNWAAAAVGVVVQAFAFLAVALLRPGSPHEVFIDYASIAAAHASLPGIHLMGLLSAAADTTTTMALLVAVSFSLAVFVSTKLAIPGVVTPGPLSDIRDYALFAVLCLWGLLVAYHRGYDIALALPALALLLHVLRNPSSWGIGNAGLHRVLILAIVSFVILIIPVRFIEDIMGWWWDGFIKAAITFDLLMLLAASLLLMRQMGTDLPLSAGLRFGSRRD